MITTINVDSADAEISRTDNVVVERIGVRTGNAMIDQYEPYYWNSTDIGSTNFEFEFEFEFNLI